MQCHNCGDESKGMFCAKCVKQPRCFACHKLFQPARHKSFCDPCVTPERTERYAHLAAYWAGEQAGRVLPGRCKSPQGYGSTIGSDWASLGRKWQVNIEPLYDPSGRRWVTIIGAAGVGKTWVASAAIFRAFAAGLGECYCELWSTVVGLLRRARSFGEDGHYAAEWLARMVEADFVCIDQFSGQTDVNAEDFLIQRYAASKSTLILTTHSLADIETMLGSAIKSRIESSVVLQVSGADRRLDPKAQPIIERSGYSWGKIAAPPVDPALLPYLCHELTYWPGIEPASVEEQLAKYVFDTFPQYHSSFHADPRYPDAPVVIPALASATGRRSLLSTEELLGIEPVVRDILSSKE